MNEIETETGEVKETTILDVPHTPTNEELEDVFR